MAGGPGLPAIWLNDRSADHIAPRARACCAPAAAAAQLLLLLLAAAGETGSIVDLVLLVDLAIFPDLLGARYAHRKFIGAAALTLRMVDVRPALLVLLRGCPAIACLPACCALPAWSVGARRAHRHVCLQKKRSRSVADGDQSFCTFSNNIAARM